MRSEQPGPSTSDPEVTNVSEHGFWVRIGGRERFLAFKHFPWFRDVPIGKLLKVRLPRAGHLRWPELDVDLAIESIEHPDRFPLISRAHLDKRRLPRTGRGGRDGNGPRGRRNRD